MRPPEPTDEELAAIAVAIALAEGCACEPCVDILTDGQVKTIDVRHDDWCPGLRLHRARDN
jgi:hypothetical protein